jgi:hypothetical protein
VRYVGKVQQRPGEGHAEAMERCVRQHIQEARSKDGRYRRLNWLKRLIREGRTPRVTLLDIGDVQTWESLEQWHIGSHRAAGYDLVNSTIGGIGNASIRFTPRAKELVFSGVSRWPRAHGPREPGVTAETMDYAFLHVLAVVPLDLDEEHH